MNFPGKKLFFNQKVIALISLVLFSFLLVGALQIVGLYEGLAETELPSAPIPYTNIPYRDPLKELNKSPASGVLMDQSGNRISINPIHINKNKKIARSFG
jgi:hypothetical protein